MNVLSQLTTDNTALPPLRSKVNLQYHLMNTLVLLVPTLSLNFLSHIKCIDTCFKDLQAGVTLPHTHTHTSIKQSVHFPSGN